MKRKLTALLCVVFLGIMSSGSSWAGKPDKSWKEWFGHFSAGYVLAQGDTSDGVDDTWTLGGGATWWPSSVGVDIDLSWTDFDVSNDAIRRINDEIGADPDNRIDDGSIALWALTTNAIWSPDTGGKASFYLAGGVGAYYLDGVLTTRGLVYYPPICDPWWWWCRPGGVAPGNIRVADESATEFGYNAGIGINVDLASGSQIYFEAKYHQIDTRRKIDYIPILVGYRW